MNILKVQTASYYKSAFSNGLTLTGVEYGQPQWLGDNVQWSNFNDGK